MIYGSVCSGIEAATVAWHPLGWQAAWYSEIEKFPSKVLAHYYPETPNLGDMTKITELEAFRERPIELLVGGTPCQSFSVAGLRKGLADPRGNLALHFLKIVDVARPRWVVWENVPGVLSSWGADKGIERNAFDAFTAGLGELGYGVAWRTLDAQYFGVAQRRRRVFVVGYLGDWRPATAVLFERTSLSGHPAPSRKTGQSVAGTFAKCTYAGGAGGVNNQSPLLVNGGGFDDQVCIPLDMRNGGRDPEKHDEQNRQGVGVGENGDPAGTVSAAFQPGVVHSVALRGRDGGATAELGGEQAGSLRAGGGGGDKAHALVGMSVRRLTPRECEMLQGFTPITEYVRIDLCLDLIKNCVNVALSCRRSQSGVSLADAKELYRPVSSVEKNSLTNQDSSVSPVALRVLINSGGGSIQASHRQEKSESVSGAEKESLISHQTLSENIVQTLVPQLQELGLEIRNGKAVSPANINLSMQALSGKKPVKEYGDGNEGSASVAVKDQSKDTFTTEKLGSLSPASDSRQTTLLCSVLSVIAGFIPNKTLPVNFSIEFITENDYTLIPGAADGPRYKALGNSMAVPVMAWLGQRIQEVDKCI